MPKFLDKMERAGGENFSLPKFLDKRERAGEKLQVAVQFVGSIRGGELQFVGKSPQVAVRAPIRGGEPQVAVQFVGRSSNSWGRAPGHRFTCERSPGHRSLTRRSVTRRSVTRKSVTRRHLRGIKGT